MKIVQLNHVALHVDDVDKSCKFYRNVLQLEEIERPAFPFPGAWFRLGRDQELHLIGERDDAVNSKRRGNHWALKVDDLEAWEKSFKERGIECSDRQTRPDGAYQIYLDDPDGHCIELCTAPGAALGQNRM